MQALFRVLLFCSSIPIHVAQVWTQLPDFPAQKRDDGVAAVVNSTLFFGTGLREGVGLGEDVYAFDLSTEVWKKIAPLPPGAQRQYASAFSVNDGFYMLTGQGPDGLTATMYKYNVADNNWVVRAPFPGGGILGLCCLNFGDQVIFAGGRFSDGSLSRQVWAYHVETDTWTRRRDVPFGGRWRACATVWRNIGYLLFGQDESDRYRNELYAYDPTTDTWDAVSSFPGPGRNYATVQAADNRLLIFAGIDSSITYHRDLWIFDPVWKTWSAGPSLPGVGRKGGMSTVANGIFYYSCGISPGDLRLSETWQFKLPQGMGTESDSAVVVFPIPCEGELFVQGSVTESLKLLDVGGYPVQAPVSGYGSDWKMNLGALPSGLYVLEINTPSGVLRKRIVRR